jgi:hypothetical protein
MISLGLPVPPNSALVTADQRRALHASLPGEYGLLVKPTQRNHRKLTLPISLRNGIKRALFPTRPGASARYKLANNEGIAFSAGIKLNGRDYIQGNSVEYVPYVQRRGNALGAGGLDGSSLCVTTISHTRTQPNIHTHTHAHTRSSFVTSLVASFVICHVICHVQFFHTPSTNVICPSLGRIDWGRSTCSTRSL